MSTLEREERKKGKKERDGSALLEGSWYQYRVKCGTCVYLSVYVCVAFDKLKVTRFSL